MVIMSDFESDNEPIYRASEVEIEGEDEGDTAAIAEQYSDLDIDWNWKVHIIKNHWLIMLGSKNIRY